MTTDQIIQTLLPKAFKLRGVPPVLEKAVGRAMKKGLKTKTGRLPIRGIYIGSDCVSVKMRRDAVWDFVILRGSVTIKDVAERFGLTRNAATRDLEQIYQGGGLMREKIIQKTDRNHVLIWKYTAKEPSI